MKGQKNSSWEFHGFASNPEKSFEAGKKGNRLAVQASLDRNRPAAETEENPGKQMPRSAQGKGWQNAGSTQKQADKQGDADE